MQAKQIDEFLLRQMKSDISLANKLKLFNSSSQSERNVMGAELDTQISLVIQPLSTEDAFVAWEDLGYDYRLLSHVEKKILPNSMSYDDVVKYLNDERVYFQTIDLLMAVIDWTLVPKDRIVKDLGIHGKKRVWEVLILEHEIFSEEEIIELCSGYWRGEYQTSKFICMYCSDLRKIALASPLLSRENKVKLATYLGSTNAAKYFEVVLCHEKFDDKELIEIAESGMVDGCWSMIMSYLTKYRYLMKVARILKTDYAWRTFMEKTDLSNKGVSQVLRAAKASGYPPIWKLYFQKAGVPRISHEEMVRYGHKFSRFGLWAVLFEHIDYSKLSVEWVKEFTWKCLEATATYRSGGATGKNAGLLRENFEAMAALGENIPWGTVLRKDRIELFCAYSYQPWQISIV
ncbi:MAG: hypothetical protein MRY49_03130, partial [Candidatus Pacebacteria bacterium]|nr:hypothetical protein [Candidatus Paceibacterota bacterium]